MKKIFLSIVVVLCVITICNSQTLPLPLPILQKGWERIYIKNVGSFDLPPTMEVQQGKYRESVDNSKKIKGVDVTQLTAQQKGLNEYGKESFEKYARVMIKTTVGEINEYEKLDSNINGYSQEDIHQFNVMYKQQMQYGLIGTGLKLIEWYPLRIEKINAMFCIHISYKRQLQDAPFVLVHMYMFHNNDRMHTFTLSYRLSEINYWEADFATILKSFRITNIK